MFLYNISYLLCCVMLFLHLQTVDSQRPCLMYWVFSRTVFLCVQLILIFVLVYLLLCQPSVVPCATKPELLFYFLFKSGALFSTICGTLFRGQSEITKSECNFSSDSIWAFSLLIDSVQIHFVYCFFRKFGLDLTHSKVREAKTAISHHRGKHKPVKT